ncbi:hypothetical protein SAMN04488573_1174 [Bacillus sp. 5mfcol3.1]|nr:hypothetical protein SAMN04488573_1174 [Bacillus sp. 5mfcol3.1]
MKTGKIDAIMKTPIYMVRHGDSPKFEKKRQED